MGRGMGRWWIWLPDLRLPSGPESGSMDYRESGVGAVQSAGSRSGGRRQEIGLRNKESRHTANQATICPEMGRLGKLLVLEGPDGTGKSTLARALVKRLEGAGTPWEYVAFPGK